MGPPHLESGALSRLSSQVMPGQRWKFNRVYLGKEAELGLQTLGFLGTLRSHREYAALGRLDSGVMPNQSSTGSDHTSGRKPS